MIHTYKIKHLLSDNQKHLSTIPQCLKTSCAQFVLHLQVIDDKTQGIILDVQTLGVNISGNFLVSLLISTM